MEPIPNLSVTHSYAFLNTLHSGQWTYHTNIALFLASAVAVHLLTSPLDIDLRVSWQLLAVAGELQSSWVQTHRTVVLGPDSYRKVGPEQIDQESAQKAKLWLVLTLGFSWC